MNKNSFSKLTSKLKGSKKLVMMAISGVVFIAAMGLLIYETTKKDVVLVSNGEEQTVRTHADTVEELLSQVGIDVTPHDEILPGQSEEISKGMTVTHKTAKQIFVTVDEKTSEYYTTAETFGDFLKENNIEVKPHDEISVDEATAITDGLEVQIDQSFQVTLNDAGEEQTYWTTADTVEQFLQEEQIELNALDKLNIDKDALISSNVDVEITRVEKVEDVVKEEIDYATVTKNDSSLPKGQKKVVQNGEEGVVVKRYEVVLENGKEVDRKLISEEVEKESQNQIVALGTKAPEPQVNYTVSRGDSGEAVKEYVMRATVYTEKCNGCSGITATGIDLRNAPNTKVVAVDPNVIPLGSKVWVEGYGYAIAGDTGGAIKGNRIDLFIHSSKYSGGYGVRTVKVKVY